MEYQEIIDWLVAGDVSIQYQVHRDLLDTDRPDLRARIATEGWGHKFLLRQNPDGHWGRKFYQPKWTSTHYTLLDLRNLCISPQNEKIQNTIKMLFENEMRGVGSINPTGSVVKTDVCVNGMFLNYAVYFMIGEEDLRPIIDFILSQRMPDGGFNCNFAYSGARHSSLHSTLSVLEGISEYISEGYNYRLQEVKAAEDTARKFILQHQLYISDRTGEVINKNFLKLACPPRWKYDILRALDYFSSYTVPFDARMQPAIDVLISKRHRNGHWVLPAKYPGQTHFDMEKAGKPSRWNTLRAMRVLRHFGISI